MKSNKLKKWLAAPYAVWAAGFIIIPLILILYYAFTGEEGGFTLSNFAYVATKENIKALGLALWLSLLSTALCLLLAYPLAMILANRNVNQTSFIVRHTRLTLYCVLCFVMVRLLRHSSCSEEGEDYRCF